MSQSCACPYRSLAIQMTVYERSAERKLSPPWKSTAWISTILVLPGSRLASPLSSRSHGKGVRRCGTLHKYSDWTVLQHGSADRPAGLQQWPWQTDRLPAQSPQASRANVRSTPLSCLPAPATRHAASWSPWTVETRKTRCLDCDVCIVCMVRSH